jgi:hypothetical protein
MAKGSLGGLRYRVDPEKVIFSHIEIEYFGLGCLAA